MLCFKIRNLWFKVNDLLWDVSLQYIDTLRHDRKTADNKVQLRLALRAVCGILSALLIAHLIGSADALCSSAWYTDCVFDVSAIYSCTQQSLSKA